MLKRFSCFNQTLPCIIIIKTFTDRCTTIESLSLVLEGLCVHGLWPKPEISQSEKCPAKSWNGQCHSRLSGLCLIWSWFWDLAGQLAKWNGAISRHQKKKAISRFWWVWMILYFILINNYKLSNSILIVELINYHSIITCYTMSFYSISNYSTVRNFYICRDLLYTW